MYQAERKQEIAHAMGVPVRSLDLYYAAWAAIREAYDRSEAQAHLFGDLPLNVAACVGDRVGREPCINVGTQH